MFKRLDPRSGLGLSERRERLVPPYGRGPSGVGRAADYVMNVQLRHHIPKRRNVHFRLRYSGRECGHESCAQSTALASDSQVLGLAKLVGVFDTSDLRYKHEPRIGGIIYHKQARYGKCPDGDGVCGELGVERESHELEPNGARGEMQMVRRLAHAAPRLGDGLPSWRVSWSCGFARFRPLSAHSIIKRA